MPNDPVEISFSDDEPEETQKPPEPPNRIVITKEDLLNVPDAPQRPAYAAPAAWTAPYGKAAPPVSGRAIAPSVLAGLAGGVLAWLLAEALVGWQADASGAGRVLVEMGFFGALMGGAIGACLGASEGLSDGVLEKALVAGMVGLGIGAGGGFAGGLVGQFFFGVLLAAGGASGVAPVMLARVVGWSIVGTCIGLGQGIGRGSGKRVVNGVLGGVIGGFVAGFLFDPISMVVPHAPGDTGTASRAVGITILGAATGLAIGLVDQIRKEAWLSVTQGPAAGKQFILYEARTRIGSSPKCEITLFKDAGILSEHAVIEDRGTERILTAANPQSPPLLNGRPCPHARLSSGCVITLGSTSLLYEERAMPSYTKT